MNTFLDLLPADLRARVEVVMADDSADNGEPDDALVVAAFTPQQARDAAIAQVSRNATPAWKKVAADAIRAVANDRYEFTTDDVWVELERAGAGDAREPRALGALMRFAAADGLIAPTARYVESKRAVNHARPLRVWHSLVYRQQTLGGEAA